MSGGGIAGAVAKAAGDAVGVDVETVFGASSALVAQARAVRAAGGEVPEVVVPEDHFELDELLAEWARVTAAFEASFAAGLEAAGLRMAEVTMDAQRADVLGLAQLPAVAGGDR